MERVDPASFVRWAEKHPNAIAKAVTYAMKNNFYLQAEVADVSQYPPNMHRWPKDELLKERTEP
jgi:hypothetical protein